MRVFVYGTLKRDGRLNPALNSSEYLGEHTTAPEFTMVALGWFPGVLHRGTTPIQGEVFEINEDILSRLDSIEGYPALYNREEIETEHGTAWMYIYNTNRVQEALNVIPNGVRNNQQRSVGG